MKDSINYEIELNQKKNELQQLISDIENTKIQLGSFQNDTIFRELAHIFQSEILDYIDNIISDAINSYLSFLELYPNNADVLFDKSCNYALLNDYPNCLKNLKMAINISNKFKINSRENKSFESLRKIKEFQKLIEQYGFLIL